MKKWMVLFVGVMSLTSVISYGQFKSMQKLDLDCVHLYPIQMKYFERHVNFAKSTKNLEARTVDQFIDHLDGSKLYFLKTDISKIKSKIMPGIYGKLKKKECKPIQETNDLFVKRVEERVEYAKKFLGSKFKFNPKAKIYRDPKNRPRPSSVAEANKYHENYMNYQVASYLATDMKLDEAKQHIIRNYERALRRVKDQSREDLYSLYVDAFAKSLDPHTSYLSADDLEDFEIQMRLSLEGIGATLSSQDGFTVIEQLVSGGSAQSSGKLKPKDKIIGVAQGKDPNFQNVIEMDLRDVVRLIRGPKGSSVTLQILRKKNDGADRFTVTLVRDKIKLEDEAASVTYIDREMENTQKKGEKVKKKIALLNLPSFYSDSRSQKGRSAAADMRKILADINKEKADAVVLDLSTNGGGSLRDAVDIAGFFFKTGNVVKQSSRVPAGSKAEYEVLRDTDPDVNWSGPLVVLVSRVSASASEIVSGTLQDYHRAVIVGGDHTFGKGTVQSVEYLPAGLGAIKTTVGMFFTAGGNSTQHRGVKSDITFPSALSIDEIGEKTLDYSLPPKSIPSFTSKSAYVTSGEGHWDQVNPSIIKKLDKLSQSRIASSDAFKKVKKDIAKIDSRKKTITAGELLEDKKGKGDKTAKVDPKTAEGDDESPLEEDEGRTLSREERQKKYLERGDVQEAINIAADLSAMTDRPELRLGAQSGDSKTKAAETN
ncbi:MAG TPA: tail-specific protease [Bdellovibrionales bacterium]|nr:tail-specific protease [Pseudobdellovibrionaceae bacterium]HAG90849.1 tail-specific protease [Bdellovibrionales bacterium]|tara:strand:- start:8676 stop:10811 length:2136 start_codon:yes stop_codon:yes gene_type:complete